MWEYILWVVFSPYHLFVAPATFFFLCMMVTDKHELKVVCGILSLTFLLFYIVCAVYAHWGKKDFRRYTPEGVSERYGHCHITDYAGKMVQQEVIKRRLLMFTTLLGMLLGGVVFLVLGQLLKG